MLIPRIWTSSTIYIFTGSIITDLICWLQKCDSQFNKDIIFISFSCETNTVVWGSTELPTCGCRFDLNHQCACEEVRGGYRVVVESRCPECEGAPFKGGTWYSLGSVWVNRNCYQIFKSPITKNDDRSYSLSACYHTRASVWKHNHAVLLSQVLIKGLTKALGQGNFFASGKLGSPVWSLGCALFS
jgi:hypothetical protein